MTSFPYWGIILIVVINAILVNRMHIEVRDDQTDTDHG